MISVNSSVSRSYGPTSPHILGRRVEDGAEPRPPSPDRRCGGCGDEAGIDQFGELLTDRVGVAGRMVGQLGHVGGPAASAM